MKKLLCLLLMIYRVSRGTTVLLGLGLIAAIVIEFVTGVCSWTMVAVGLFMFSLVLLGGSYFLMRTCKCFNWIFRLPVYIR